ERVQEVHARGNVAGADARGAGRDVVPVQQVLVGMPRCAVLAASQRRNRTTFHRLSNYLVGRPCFPALRGRDIASRCPYLGDGLSGSAGAAGLPFSFPSSLRSSSRNLHTSLNLGAF